MNLLDTDQYLIDAIFNDFPNAYGYSWETDGSLELLDADGKTVVRLSVDQVDKYIANILEDESKDDDDGLQDYYIEDDAF